MRQNENTVIRGERVILVPYRIEHVHQYHQWMQDPQLQDWTASDPLTLEEEYQMQKTWHNDNDKCTFILLDPDRPEGEATGGRGGGMVGDVNFFIHDPDDKSIAEIEVMIAVPESRGKGIAFEALILFMLYGITELGLSKFIAKISERNVASQSLFRKLGYSEQSRSAIFHEITYSLEISETVKEQLMRHVAGVVRPLEPYDHT